MSSYIVKDENAQYYEAGFSCDHAFFLCLENEKYFITDARYTGEAKEEVNNSITVVDGERALIQKVIELIKEKNIKELIYDAKDLSILDLEELQKIDIELKREVDFSHKKRIIKTDTEIIILREAARLGASKFDEFANFLSNANNMSEKKLFFYASNILKEEGELSLSFDPIIALEENAAKPHALASSKKLKYGDLILFDAGIKYKRYCSDRTRVINFNADIVFDKNRVFEDKEKQKIYNLVVKSNLEAIAAVKPGVKASYIDKVARDVIKEAGYGEFFIHSTGHGVGLDIHEMPYISKNSTTILEEGMVFTIEPGIYLAGKFGVRIEDMVVVTKDGCEVL